MRFLYPTDGSTAAAAVASFLLRLPLTAEDRIHLLTVLRKDDPSTGEEILAASREDLYSFPGTITAAVKRVNRAENTADAILRTVIEESHDLITIGASGYRAVARFFLGSVAEAVARHSVVPVLVARPTRGPLEQIVIGTDGSEDARAAACFALTLPLPHDISVRLIHVLPTREAGSAEFPLAQHGLERLAGDLQDVGWKVQKELREGKPGEELLHAARTVEGSLLVVGSRGAGSSQGLFLGGVADYLLQNATCPLLVVK